MNLRETIPLSRFWLLVFAAYIEFAGWNTVHADTMRLANTKPALKEVLSTSCAQRANVVRTFLGESETRSAAESRRTVEAEAPQAIGYFRNAIEYFELEEKASDESLHVVQETMQLASKKFENTPDNRSQIAEYVAANVRKAALTRKESVRRFLTVYLIEQVKQYQGAPEERAFLDMAMMFLSDKDPDSRAYASATMIFRGLEGHENLVPHLVAGLESKSFGVRYASIKALEELGGPRTCYNPLDPPAQRAQSVKIIRQWSRVKLR